MSNELPKLTAACTKKAIEAAGIPVNNIPDLIQRVYLNSDFSLKVCTELVRITIDQMSKILQDEEAMNLAGLGTFVVKKSRLTPGLKKRSRLDPNKKVECIAKAHVKFKESRTLFLYLNRDRKGLQREVTRENDGQSITKSE